MTLWYISFATDDDGFLGATVVEATSADGAIAEATRRNLNPGGEAAIVEVPKAAENEPDMLAIVNRLAGEEEMIAQGGRRAGDLPEEIQDDFEAAATHVCEGCNDGTRSR